MASKHKVNSKSPLTLDDLEIRLLSPEQIKRNQEVKVLDSRTRVQSLKAVKTAIRNRFERRLSVFALAIVTILLFIGVIFPDRYEYVNDSVKLFLAATSGFFVAKVL